MAYIKLNKKNLYYNLNQLALKSGNKSKIAAVLKDNAYGHGLIEMAKMVSQYGLTQAVVIDNNEAKEIKSLFQNILILNDTPQKTENFSYAVKELKSLNSISKDAKIELKVDTGMHRNGILLNELPEALDIIKRRELKLFGIFTHFRSADILSSELAWQIDNFNIVKSITKNKGFKNIRFHSFNSAALLRYKSFSEDMARVGIAMYGYNELPKVISSIELKPILSLWAKRVSTRVLKRGQKVGYGAEFIANRDMIVSTYDVGYGDGLFRGDSKKPLILPSKLPILGRVSMDFISIESVEDEICIIDNAKDVAQHFNTISYEITTKLKRGIKRVII